MTGHIPCTRMDHYCCVICFCIYSNGASIIEPSPRVLLQHHAPNQDRKIAPSCIGLSQPSPDLPLVAFENRDQSARECFVNKDLARDTTPPKFSVLKGLERYSSCGNRHGGMMQAVLPRSTDSRDLEGRSKGHVTMGDATQARRRGSSFLCALVGGWCDSCICYKWEMRAGVKIFAPTYANNRATSRMLHPS